MIKYDRLWELLKQKKITQCRLIKDYGIASFLVCILLLHIYMS